MSIDRGAAPYAGATVGRRANATDLNRVYRPPADRVDGRRVRNRPRPAPRAIPVEEEGRTPPLFVTVTAGRQVYLDRYSKPERNAAIVAMRATGATVRAIAAVFGISHVRVLQVLNNNSW